MRTWRWAAAVVVAWCGVASAATYYVDFAGGSDDNEGLSAEKAFKHCPGDTVAAGKAKAATLAAGDKVLFKGGVTYFGSIPVKSSGEKDRPIVFDGNSGMFGAGPAVIDGADPLTGWKRCASADEAKGNPRWKDIFHLDVPRVRAWNGLNLSSETKPLPVAQDPNPTDPFLQESPEDFYVSPSPLTTVCEAKVSAEPGTHEDRTRPLVLLLARNASSTAVVAPLPGGAFTITLPKAVTVKSVGLWPQPNYPAVGEAAFYGDGNELLRAKLSKDAKGMQKFDLPAPATFTRFTVKLTAAADPAGRNFTAIRQAGAFDEAGKNVLDFPIRMTMVDANHLTQASADYYTGMILGFHGGANMVEYLPVEEYVPAEHRLYAPFFGGNVYKPTKYCFLNSVRLIDVPGEYSVEPGPDAKTSRVFFLPEKLEDDQPVGVGCSKRGDGFLLQGASHVVLQGFHVRRQGGAGNQSGIYVSGPAAGIVVRDCEVSLVRGGAGISLHRTSGAVVENCCVRDCPGHTRGIVIQDSNDALTRNCLLVKNTSTALDYYTVTDGRVTGCTVLDHRGMHANGLTFYLGCRNILIDRNRIERSNIGITFQSAEGITIADNVIDSGGKTLCIGIWPGQPLKDVRILNNCLVRSAPEHQWQAALFTNSKAIEGLVVKNNVIDGLSGKLTGQFSHNVYTQWGPNLRDANSRKLGPAETFEPDLKKLFADPDKGDWRPKAGGPLLVTGTDVGLKEDFAGAKFPKDKPDIGAYQHKE